MSSRKSRSSRKGEGSNGLQAQLRVVIDELVHSKVSLEQARNEFERLYIVAALEADSGAARAAERLGVHRNTLRNKMASLGISTADIARRR